MENNMQTDKSQASRILYLDIIKCISIFLVVFCHTPLLNKNSVVGNIAMIICWGAVTCFFMVTGAIILNKEKKFDFKRYINKLISIYLIICIWKIIYLIFYNFFGYIKINAFSKGQIINYILLFSSLKGIPVGHFWFMYVYLSIYIIYPMFNLCFKNFNDYKNLLIFLLLAIFIISILPQTFGLILKYFNINSINFNEIINVNPFGKYSHMLFYFLFGGFLYKYNLYEKCKKNKIISCISIVLIIIGIIGLMLVKKYYANTFEWQGIYLKDGYKWFSTVLLSIGLFVFLQGRKYKFKYLNKILSYIGKNTMGIFYLHILVIQLLMKIDIVQRGTLVNTLKTIIVVFISAIITTLLKKIPVIKKLVQ